VNGGARCTYDNIVGGAARSKQLLQQTTPRAWIFSERMHAHGLKRRRCSAARTDVIQPDRLLPLGREIQCTSAGRVCCSFAIPTFRVSRLVTGMANWRSHRIMIRTRKDYAGRHRAAANMESLRGHGCREFGVLATSYGGWIGALLTSSESDFRIVALMSPIVNVEQASGIARRRVVFGANWSRLTSSALWLHGIFI